MWFKNLQIYVLPKNWNMDANQLSGLLEKQKFTACSSKEMESMGWFPIKEEGELVYSVGKQMLIMLRTEKKLLPGSVVTYFAKEKAKEMEERDGFYPGKKRMKEIKEQVTDELLPRAFSTHSNTLVWIDPVNGWLVVDSGSTGKADEVIKRLLKAIDKFPIEGLRVAQSPITCMTSWLENEEAPQGFTVDQDTELRANNEGKATVRFVHHSLERKDVRDHIAEGKQCTRLALTWNDRISFILTDNLIIKKLTALDILKEASIKDGNEDERFDSDVTLMCGELNTLMSDVIDALGGRLAD